MFASYIQALAILRPNTYEVPSKKEYRLITNTNKQWLSYLKSIYSESSLTCGMKLAEEIAQ
jgi:hypothetical protein